MQASSTAVALLLVGAAGSEFRRAAAMAADAGAEVTAVDTIDGAMQSMRSKGADLAIVDVETDIADLIAMLRRERMALPVYACGVDASAGRAVAAIRAGACDYLPLPPDRDLIAAVIVSVARNNAVMIGNDPALDRARTLGSALAPARTAFMITGEPGSGRELLARTVHTQSGRRGRFVVVDCAGTDRMMIDSELFGHEAGSFPGAVADRCGRLWGAEEGTLYLAEVSSLPPATQDRLAAHLADRGRQHPLQRPARIIASMADDIDACLADGRLRPALHAQIGLVRLALPPLRSRGADIALLVRHFSDRFAAQNELPPRPFSDEAMAVLRGHDWPGNVAELEDVVHRAVVVSAGNIIGAAAIMLADGGRLGRRGTARSMLAAAAAGGSAGVNGLVGSTVVDVERALILETLKACSGNRTSAAGILGISVRTMRNKLKSFLESGPPMASLS